LTGVGTPWIRPRRTISPLRKSASIVPVRRLRLCHDDPPERVVPSITPYVTWSPRMVSNSSRGAWPMPAARKTAIPSERARRRSSLASSSCRASGPHSASTALARLLRSLPYFQRMTSALAGARKRLAARAALNRCVKASVPDG
jgi:hypothetical protein